MTQQVSYLQKFYQEVDLKYLDGVLYLPSHCSWSWLWKLPNCQNWANNSDVIKFKRVLHVHVHLFVHSPNFSSTHEYIFRNLWMVAYIIDYQKSKFANIFNSTEFDQSEPGRQIKFSVYFHPARYISWQMDLVSLGNRCQVFWCLIYTHRSSNFHDINTFA